MKAPPAKGALNWSCGTCESLKSAVASKTPSCSHATAVIGSLRGDTRLTPHVERNYMSVNSVQMFYSKLASDMMMRNAFAQATGAATIAFAAERGFMFTAYDLQIAGERMRDFAKQLGDDVKQLQSQEERLTVGKAAGQAAGQATRQPVLPLGDISVIMELMQRNLIHARLGAVFAGASGSKKG